VKQVTSKARGVRTNAHEDPRSQSADRKRERMRARLLDATMKVCSDIGYKPIVIEDILRTSGVSRGTFYAHFDSLYDAMASLADRFAEDLHKSLLFFYRDLDDPVRRISLGLQAMLVRASIEPMWARAFAASRGSDSASMIQDVQREFERGRELGLIQFDDVHAAMDITLGACIRAARRLETMKSGQIAYIHEIAKGCLRSLGMSEKRAIELARWAMNDLLAKAKTSEWLAVNSQHKSENTPPERPKKQMRRSKKRSKEPHRQQSSARASS